jgi:uncharacterized OsmC-like protein
MNEKIHAHVRREKGYRSSVTFDELRGVELHMDEPKPVGMSEGPSAAMMLSSAIGHCLTSSLMFCIEKSRGAVKDVQADVETSLTRNEKGRWRVAGIKVNMKVDVGDIDKEKLERCKGIFEDFCIVTASVREGVKIDVEVAY